MHTQPIKNLDAHMPPFPVPFALIANAKVNPNTKQPQYANPECCLHSQTESGQNLHGNQHHAKRRSIPSNAE